MTNMFCLLDTPDQLWDTSDGSEAADLPVTVGCKVSYTFRGVDSFVGKVTAIDAAGRVEVEADGERSWCARDRLRVILVAEAVEVG